MCGSCPASSVPDLPGALADAVPIMLWQSGPDKLATYFNRRWLEFTGRSHDEQAGHGWIGSVHPDDAAHCLATYNEAFDRRRETEMQYRLLRHDGQYRWILDRGGPMLSKDGDVIGYVRGCIDINDRTRYATERHLEIHDHALQTLFGIGLVAQAALQEVARGGDATRLAAALVEIGELASNGTTTIKELIDALAIPTPAAVLGSRDARPASPE